MLTASCEPTTGLHEPPSFDRPFDRFLATLCHELRNPLAPILSGAQVLRLVGDDDWTVVRETGALLERQVGHIVRILDDLGDVSRARRGRLALNRAPVGLRTVVDGAVDGIRPLVDAHGHSLRVHCLVDDVAVDGDAARLKRSVSHLLRNAAQHTEQSGPIDLVLKRETSEAVIQVVDSGLGIAADDLPFLFDFDRRWRRPTEHSAEGLGLGLPLVDAVVRLHGGRVEARSDGLRRGSQFVIRLPVLDEASGGSRHGPCGDTENDPARTVKSLGAGCR